MRSRFTPTDALLLLVVSIWGSNFTIVKAAIEQIPPLGFNALRLVIACVVLVGAARLSGAGLPARADWPRMVALGLVGHCGYQLSFIQGLARTSVTNSSLILGCLPVTVLLLNAVSRRRERVGRWQWVGVVLAVVGVYLVVGVGAQLAGDTLQGDLTIMLSVWCWGWYTVGSRPLLRVYTPLQVTACTTVIGSIAFAPFAGPSLVSLDWYGVSGWAWAAVVASGVLALSLSYVLWYTGVQCLGSARTSVYSNLVPVVAMVVAAVALNESIGAVKLVGAALVLFALALTRIDRRPLLG
ncbi:MAG: DMT family transporter [bacterium]